MKLVITRNTKATTSTGFRKVHRGDTEDIEGTKDPKTGKVDGDAGLFLRRGAGLLPGSPEAKAFLEEFEKEQEEAAAKKKAEAKK